MNANRLKIKIFLPEVDFCCFLLRHFIKIPTAMPNSRHITSVEKPSNIINRFSSKSTLLSLLRPVVASSRPELLVVPSSRPELLLTYKSDFPVLVMKYFVIDITPSPPRKVYSYQHKQNVTVMVIIYIEI